MYRLFYTNEEGASQLALATLFSERNFADASTRYSNLMGASEVHSEHHGRPGDDPQ